MTFAINSIGTLETNHEFQAQSNTLLAVHIHKQWNIFILLCIKQDWAVSHESMHGMQAPSWKKTDVEIFIWKNFGLK